jgi:hypothetical protein
MNKLSYQLRTLVSTRCMGAEIFGSYPFTKVGAWTSPRRVFDVELSKKFDASRTTGAGLIAQDVRVDQDRRGHDV